MSNTKLLLAILFTSAVLLTACDKARENDTKEVVVSDNADTKEVVVSDNADTKEVVVSDNADTKEVVVGDDAKKSSKSTVVTGAKEEALAANPEQQF